MENQTLFNPEVYFDTMPEKWFYYCANCHQELSYKEVDNNDCSWCSYCLDKIYPLLFDADFDALE